MRDPDLIWTPSDENQACALVGECSKERRLMPEKKRRLYEGFVIEPKAALWTGGLVSQDLALKALLERNELAWDPAKRCGDYDFLHVDVKNTFNKPGYTIESALESLSLQAKLATPDGCAVLQFVSDEASRSAWFLGWLLGSEIRSLHRRGLTRRTEDKDLIRVPKGELRGEDELRTHLRKLYK